MTRVYVFVALLMCSPLAAAAQVPPVPPVPPAPVVAPVAPVPPSPRVVVSPPVEEAMAMIDSLDMLSSVDLQDAVIASRKMVEDLDINIGNLDIESIKDSLRQIDVEGIKA